MAVMAPTDDLPGSTNPIVLSTWTNLGGTHLVATFETGGPGVIELRQNTGSTSALIYRATSNGATLPLRAFHSATTMADMLNAAAVTAAAEYGEDVDGQRDRFVDDGKGLDLSGPDVRVWAASRPEIDPCQRGTDGCSVDHDLDDGDCEA